MGLITYTTMYLLKNAETVHELSFKNSSEIEVYKILKRISKSKGMKVVRFKDYFMLENIINEAEVFISIIDNKYNIKFAYIFGSQATGEASENSDIDIAICFSKGYEPMEEAFIRGDIIEEGRKFFKKNVDVISLNNASLLLKMVASSRYTSHYGV